ncbi:hypothetical protein [Stenotrophomonas tumulicola]|uniref:Glycosyltransferase RgtA/B/C/D-like domain-containing protein n=1 Tax=Stenotrophomonas tumulicola TaxID=1685415 RepID=A0A7W3IIK1_9GAMM|nr:hypothetical protein [Stenotrophomonas tumulicola]MBA8683213.1 hypothetical protein [Stenotrophomonas tumulicola]
MRIVTTIGAVVCIALALCWKLLPAHDGLESAAALQGGCPPSTSPYLQADANVKGAITYCEAGDAATGTLVMHIPAGTLDNFGLVVAGYVDGKDVSLNLQPTGGSSAAMSLQQRAAERWTPVALDIPDPWKGTDLTATLQDRGEQHAQWAGLGLVPLKQGAHADRGVAIALLCLAVVLALLARRARPASGPVGIINHMPMAVAMLATLLIGGHLYRGDIAGIWVHPDESIPVKVMEAMHGRGDLDTDFAKADLPVFADFRYNFSGYILAAYASAKVLSPDAFASEPALLKHLLDLSRWSAAATLVLCLLLLLRHTNALYAVIGTTLIAIVPQLYQDAHYARLESLSTLLATLVFALATLKPIRERNRHLLMAAIGLLAGMLTTIKFTYVIFLLFCIVSAMPMLPRSGDMAARVKPLLLHGLWSALGFVAGFCIASPSIVVDLAGFIAGIQALNNQYGGGHPPHGFPSPSMGKQVGLIAGYYSATIGLPLLVLHLAGYSRGVLAPAKYALGGVLGITLLAFLFQEVFFERNFGPFLPGFILVSVIGIVNIEHWLLHVLPERNWMLPALRLALAVALAFCGWTALSVTSRLAPHFSAESLSAMDRAHARKLDAYVHEFGAAGIKQIGFPDIMASTFPQPAGECELYQGIHYNDGWSKNYYHQLEQRGFRLVARMASDFDEVPVSTLNVYHSPTMLLYYAPAGCSREGVPQ